MLVCPNRRLTVSIGTPLDNNMVVAAECLATWNIQGKASESGQVKIKRNPFEMSIVSVFRQMEKKQIATEY